MIAGAANHRFKMGGGLLPVERVIHDLCELAVAPRESWRTIVDRLNARVHVPTSDAGLSASLVAAHARGLVKQIQLLNGETETEMRGVCRALANVLQIELNAKHAGEEPRRHYARD